MPPKKPPKLKEPAAPPKQQETTEVQRAQVITLRGEGLSYAKIADIVKHDKERREPDINTPYTASATRSSRPLNMTCHQRRCLIHLEKLSRRAPFGILCRSITIRVSMKTAQVF